jgi:glycosyltransferase involved in cell wall biosynthesis
MEPPEISVIVPVHNEEQYVGRCMRSLLDQDIDRSLYELILVDDGSTDRSAYAIDMFSDEIRIVSMPTNKGLPSALNAGIRNSQGRFIVRVDADDYVNARFLSLLHMWLTENPEIDAVACDYLLVDNNEEVISRESVDEHPIACGIMFRMNQLTDIGAYDEEFLLHEDLEFRFRFLMRYTISRIPLPLYRYRRHESNMTNDLDRQEHFLSRLRDKHGDDALRSAKWTQ